MPLLKTLKRRYRQRARRAVGGRRRRYAIRGKMAKKPLVKLIRSVMKREEETKYVANSNDAGLAPLANMWYSTGSLAAGGNWFPAIPKLGQGTGDYQRIGGKISPVGMNVTLKIGFNPQNVEAASLYCVIFYGTSRANKSWNSTTLPIGNQQILDVGDGTNTTWNGDRFRLNYPIDKKLYNVKRLVFRMTKTEGIQNTDISGASVVGGNYSTANGLQCRNVKLNFRVPKKLMYEDNADVMPSNYAPFFGVGFCHADGSTLTVADQKLVTVSSQCHLWFKDA